jgi:hypothetical protein
MRKPIQIALAFAILTLVFAAGARVGQRQAEQRLAEQQQRRALEDVLWLLPHRSGSRMTGGCIPNWMLPFTRSTRR